MADFLASDCARQQARGGRWVRQLHGFHRRSRCQADSRSRGLGCVLTFSADRHYSAPCHSRAIHNAKVHPQDCRHRKRPLPFLYENGARKKTPTTRASDCIRSVRYPIIDEIFWLPVRMQITSLSLRVQEWANGSSPDLAGSRNGNSCDH